ncbi:MAG: GTP-binding protein [Pseudomonadota bacterium]
MTPKIPVTVLTGFLGSGKTTLLNRILSEDHGLRIAVIENEFGEIGIDQDLVINAEEEVFEMNNGCICCNVRGDLIRILAELADRRDQFDRIVLETTGMADPAPVAQTFLVQDDVQEFYEIDGIITLVDSKHVGQHLDDETDEVLAQVAFADRIIVNKIDLITDEEKHAVQDRLRSMNTMATLYEATMADAPIAELLDIGGFNVDRAVEMKPNFLEPEYPFEWGGVYALPAGEYALKMTEGHHHHDPGLSLVLMAVDNRSDDVRVLAESVFVEFSAEPEVITDGSVLAKTHRHYQLAFEGKAEYELRLSLDDDCTVALFMGQTANELHLRLVSVEDREFNPSAEHTFGTGHTHDSKVSSTSVELPGKFDGAKLNAWLEDYLIENGPDVYRMKGVVGIEGQDYRFVFQGVHMIFGSQVAGEWGDETPTNRLVFIGKNLDEAYIRSSLEACLA